MKINTPTILFTLIAAIVCSPFFKADTLTYTAFMKGSNVVPPTLAPATATEVLTLSGDLLSVHVEFGGLLSSALNVDIHCCSGLTQNAPLVLSLPNFPQAKSGTYDYTFSLLTDLSGISENNFLAGLNTGLAYTDLRSSNFPTDPGAIRGQIALTAEPSSLWLVASGLAGSLTLISRNKMGKVRNDAAKASLTPNKLLNMHTLHLLVSFAQRKG